MAVFLADISAQDSRQNPQESKPREQGTNATCGTEYDLALRIQTCAKPLMNILEGELEHWPKNEKETADLCNTVSGSLIYLKLDSQMLHI